MSAHAARTVFLLVAAMLFSACGPGGVGGIGGGQEDEKVVGLTINPPDQTITTGSQINFNASAQTSDGGEMSVSDEATWSSSDSAVATIANRIATGVAAGTTTISASYKGYTASTTLTVEKLIASLEVTPKDATLASGTMQQYAATATYADQSTDDITSSVTWQSTNPAVASIDAQGLVTALVHGSTQIVARFDYKSGWFVEARTNLTVTPGALQEITVSPGTAAIPLGATQRFAAQGKYTDGSSSDITQSVTWNSSAPAVATIAVGGLATSLAVGSTTITASLGGEEGSAALTVLPKELVTLTIVPASITVFTGQTPQLNALGKYTDGSEQNLTATATWISSDTAVATVVAGLVTAKAKGTATISATVGNQTALGSVTVYDASDITAFAIAPLNPSIALGQAQQFTAAGTLPNGAIDLTSLVAWQSSNTSVATISTTGLAQSEMQGITTISATLNGQSANTTLTVTAHVLDTITINPNSARLLYGAGATQAFVATGTYSDNSSADVTNLASWASSVPNVASIDATGLATADDVGTTTISATLDGITGTAALAVILPPPKTGQTTCYDTAGAVIACAGTGQDGALQTGIAWPSPRFTVGTGAEADCIVDNLTGLMWPRSVAAAKPWQEALDDANGLTLCGYDDWRLANVNELLTLVNREQATSASWLQTQGFIYPSFGNTWTSTTLFPSPDNAIDPVPNIGFTGGAIKTAAIFFMPTRGPQTLGSGAVPRTGQATCWNSSGIVINCAATGQDGDVQAGVVWPIPRFTPGSDSTAACVTDNLTGLMWVNTPDSTPRTWQQALDHANGLVLCGYDDWRLPNINELHSLAHYGQSNVPWLMSQGFSNVQYTYWSSTTAAATPASAWSLWFGPYVVPQSKTATQYVWPVRGTAP